MALTPDEQAMLEALSSEAPEQKRDVANSRQPSDLQHIPMSNLNKGLNPDEEAMLEALNSDSQTLPQNTESASVGQKIMNGVSAVGDFIDSFTGAPTRQAINTLADTGNPVQAVADFGHQFGADPNLAPTGKELAAKAGFSTENKTIQRNPMQVADEARAFGKRVPAAQEVASPAAVAGFGIDVAADPTNLLPFVPVAKVAGKAGELAKVALKGSANAVDMATGTKLVRAGEMAKNAGTSAIETTREARKSLSKLFRPDVAPDFNELSQVAAKNNIPSELLNDAVEFGENSVISRHARSVAEGPLGGDALKKHDELVHAVSNATENNIKKIAGTDSIANDVEAGGLIRQAYDDGVDNFFNQMGETYGNALKMAPDMRLDKKSQAILNQKINDWESWAKGRIGDTAPMEKVIDGANSTKREVKAATNDMLNVMGSDNKAITKTHHSQAKEVLIASQRMKKAVASGDVNQIYSIMREVGDIAFKSKNHLSETPSDIKKFQEMYFANQRALTETIRSHLGDDFANALAKNNTEMTKHFTERGHLAPIIGNKNLDDEKVFHSLIMNGGSKKIEALFNIISPEAASQLKASFLDNNLVRNADGVVNFAASRKKLNGLKKTGKLDVLFKPDDLKDLDDVLKLGDRSGIGVLSTSGTGGSNGFRNIVGTLQDKLASDALIDNFKRSARSNYVERIKETPDGIKYTEKLRAPKAETRKSGIQILRENSPITKKQAAQGARVNSIQDRNSRLEQYKKLRGL